MIIYAYCQSAKLSPSLSPPQIEYFVNLQEPQFFQSQASLLICLQRSLDCWLEYFGSASIGRQDHPILGFARID